MERNHPSARWRRGRTWFSITLVLGVVGLALTIPSLIGALLNVPVQIGGRPWMAVALEAVLVLEAGLITWQSYVCLRRRRVPPAWFTLTIVVLIYASIVLSRLR